MLMQKVVDPKEKPKENMYFKWCNQLTNKELEVSRSSQRNCKVILSSNWKNNTILTLSEIQTMRKLSKPTTILLAGLFLTVVKFNLLK